MTLDEVKPGDILILSRINVFSDEPPEETVNVDRVTTTQVVIHNDMKFQKRTGHKVGQEGYSHLIIRVPKDQAEIDRVRDIAEHYRLARKLRSMAKLH